MVTFVGNSYQRSACGFRECVQRVYVVHALMCSMSCIQNCDQAARMRRAGQPAVASDIVIDAIDLDDEEHAQVVDDTVADSRDAIAEMASMQPDSD